MSKLSFNRDTFLLDGKEFRILSGTIHYFRVVEEYWYDRLLKLKNCGFNTVETYTPWNLHERKEGKFDFSGNLNLSGFIQTASDLGLNVILRPGPYICAEWDFGGLPSWLLTYKNMTYRCNDKLFLIKVERYYTALFEQIRGHLSANGGNVIAIQIENEYGSYGNDKKYLNAIVDIYKKCGIDCCFFTSDGASDLMLGSGTLDGYLATVNFGSRPEDSFHALKHLHPDQPLMCCEFWNGWFDHWYEEHHVRDSSSTIDDLQKILKLGGSVNFYMFHGGTNFGFLNGANDTERYEPTITSYDYNAPLTESGDMTAKYHAIKKTLEAFTGIKHVLPVTDSTKIAYGKVILNKCAGLFDSLDILSAVYKHVTPLPMEELGQDFGYILYRTKIYGPLQDETYKLNIDKIHDRALIYTNGTYRGKIERGTNQKDEILLSIPQGEFIVLDILVENMGRVNYGPKLSGEKKGIIGGVRINNTYLFDWEMYPLTFDELSGLTYFDEHIQTPSFFKGSFTVHELADTFVRPDGFEKGFVKINGFNIGRFYNSAGPQKTLYVPAPLLKKGNNEIIVFESDRADALPVVTFVDTPELG